MANTTNYNWSTPDDTALVKDGAAAIRTLGTAIDTTVFNNASAGIAKTIVDAKGDIIAATAADTVSRLAVGANDTVLTADSSTATGLKWATPASKVVQIVNATYSTATTISAGSTADTGLTASITPTSASNKVLVLFSQMAGTDAAGYVNSLLLKRGSTTIGNSYASEYLYTNDNNNYYVFGGLSGSYLDSPATTSATTYKTTAQTSAAAGSVKWQWNGSQATMTLIEVTP